MIEDYSKSLTIPLYKTENTLSKSPTFNAKPSKHRTADILLYIPRSEIQRSAVIVG